MRPVLRPGLRTVRVEGRLHLTDGQCDVVLSEPAARLVQAVDGVRDGDDVLAAATPEADPAETDAAWCRLLRRRLVVDADEHLQRIAALGRSPDRLSHRSPGAATPLADLLACADGDRRWQARRACRVSIRGGGATATSLTDLLAVSGVATEDTPHQAPDLVVLTHDHEPPADLLEPLVRDDVAHLVGGLRDATARVGPFVVPGWSACTRCYDLHRTAVEPSWRWRRALLAQPVVHPLGRTTAPLPVVQLAAALLAFEVLAFAEGRTPQTCGSTLELSVDHPVPVRHRVEPHPWCGCVWPTQELDLSATMEA